MAHPPIESLLQTATRATTVEHFENALHAMIDAYAFMLGNDISQEQADGICEIHNVLDRISGRTLNE